MELKFLGGAREVGRSAVFVDTGREKLVLDYGVEVQEGKKPLKPPSGPDGVVITHAHLDHSGFAPALYCMGYQGKVFATSATFGLTSLLLEDSLKVQRKRGAEPGFTEHDIERMGKRESVLEFGRPMEFGSSTIELFRAGHIPGAAAVSVDSRGVSMLYTGDIKFMPTDLMRGAEIGRRHVDVLVSESTYSYKDHPDRRKLRAQLLSIVESTCQNGGVALLPAFAVGRTQELLVMLRGIGFPVYLDGMGSRATRSILAHPDFVQDAGALSDAFGCATVIRRGSERKDVVGSPGIIITTAGMLQGGPAGTYMDLLRHRRDCSMVLTGYQVEKTPGKMLLDTGVYSDGAREYRPEFPVHFLDFSAHTDRSHLLEFFRRMNPGKLVLVHGDRTVEFAEELRGMGFDAVAPAVGESIRI